ncbi:MAG: hypothetical protein ACXVCP_12055 [Bdellovibrio sp.]
MENLKTLFVQHHSLSPEGETFLQDLEKAIALDLWQSAGGNWSSISIENIRHIAMEKLAQQLNGESYADFQKAWTEVVRDFHQDQWGEKRLAKKEKKPKTEEDKIFWELFSYIWVLLQTTFITKTVIFYFGITSASEDTKEGKIYVVLAILFTFISLTSFAYRKSRTKVDKKNKKSDS